MRPHWWTAAADAAVLLHTNPHTLCCKLCFAHSASTSTLRSSTTDTWKFIVQSPHRRRCRRLWSTQSALTTQTTISSLTLLSSHRIALELTYGAARMLRKGALLLRTFGATYLCCRRGSTLSPVRQISMSMYDVHCILY